MYKQQQLAGCLLPLASANNFLIVTQCQREFKTKLSDFILNAKEIEANLLLALS